MTSYSLITGRTSSVSLVAESNRVSLTSRRMELSAGRPRLARHQ